MQLVLAVRKRAEECLPEARELVRRHREQRCCRGAGTQPAPAGEDEEVVRLVASMLARLPREGEEDLPFRGLPFEEVWRMAPERVSEAACVLLHTRMADRIREAQTP
jgi:hypothetical protein